VPDVQVRPVGPDEYELAGRIVVRAYESLPGNHMTGGYAEVLADVGRRAGETEVLVAVGPELLGCVTFVPDSSSPWAELLGPGEAGVRMLAVDPSAQGRGVGRALLSACIERARQLGRAALFLHSTPWMEVAHHLYESAGFVRLPERDWFPVPEVPLLAFRLALAPGTLGPARAAHTKVTPLG
jgi:ribosomal protein S18 acetylase RimI-like enzyme